MNKSFDSIREELQLRLQTAAHDFATSASEVTDSPGNEVLAEVSRFVGSMIYNVFLTSHTRYEDLGYASKLELAEALFEFANQQMVGAFEQIVQGHAKFVGEPPCAPVGTTLQ